MLTISHKVKDIKRVPPACQAINQLEYVALLYRVGVLHPWCGSVASLVW